MDRLQTETTSQWLVCGPRNTWNSGYVQQAKR
jgi:hypothetical protein